MNDFLKAVMGGVMISIGCLIYLSLDNKIAGSLLFSIGLLTIFIFKLNLFTGKVGYVVENKRIVQLLIILGGNLTGTLLASIMIHFTRLTVTEKAAELAANKAGDGPLSLFILGIFCGMLMFVAADSFAHTQKSIIPVFCVSVFILSGFEHSIADSFYFFISGLSVKSYVLPLAMVFLGNTAGAVLFNVIQKYNARGSIEHKKSSNLIKEKNITTMM